MKSKYVGMAGLLLFGALVTSLSCGKEGRDEEPASEAETGYTAADTLHWNLFIAYLQDHFDDLHDVTMRYHHKDHAINGIVEIHMLWEGGLLKSAEVVTNRTGDDDLPGSLMEKIRGWKIEGLTGPAEITLPVNVKLVGIDDPEFSNTAILTGEVKHEDGRPLEGAMINLKPEVAGVILRAETNREGVFVKTLIPPGTWTLECALPGYSAAVKEGVTLSAGQHRRETIVLKPD